MVYKEEDHGSHKKTLCRQTKAFKNTKSDSQKAYIQNPKSNWPIPSTLDAVRVSKTTTHPPSFQSYTLKRKTGIGNDFTPYKSISKSFKKD